MKIPFGA